MRGRGRGAWFTAIAEWAADADRQTLHALEFTGALPSESMFRRTLQRLDADAFDDLARAWAAAHRAGAGERRVIAVDGKTLRGSAGGGGPGDHLLAALDQPRCRAGTGGGRREDERNPDVRPCWTASTSPERSSRPTQCTPSAAMLTTWPAQDAHYLFTVKRNQPGLFAQLATLPWRHVPVAHDSRERGHGRASGAPSRSPRCLPGRRSRTPPRPSRSCAAAAAREEEWCRETVYAITS